MTINNHYILYYGWLVTDAVGHPNTIVSSITSARPQILIASYFTAVPRYVNLSSQVCDMLHREGIQIFAYVPTGYGLRSRRLVEMEVATYLKYGVDGIFLDEGYSFVDNAHVEYYRSLYTMVQRCNKITILNTGIAHSNEIVMQVTDILMVEHQWRMFYQTNSWFKKYSADRFMGISGNEPGAYDLLGYNVDLNHATQDTKEAWSEHVGWHTSTDYYTTLPEWILDYTRCLQQKQE